MRASSLRLPRRADVVAVAIAVATVAAPLASFGAASSPSARAKKTKLRENSYYYGAFNRRDPFRSLVSGTFERDSRMELVDIGSVELVGVVRGDLDRFALLEDEKGFTYVLRVGDRVRRGTVIAIGENTLTARITSFGQTRKVTLHMVDRHKGESR